MPAAIETTKTNAGRSKKPTSTVPGPGQMPERPQPTPKMRLPKTSGASISLMVGNRNSSPRNVRLRRFATEKATSPTPTAPAMTKASAVTVTTVSIVSRSLSDVRGKDYEGEVWCISKHLLAASMRLMEVGTKQLSLGNNDEAKNLFEKAYALYCLFWGVNMNIIDTSQVKKIDEQSLNKHDETKTGFFGRLGELIKRAIDCCIE